MRILHLLSQTELTGAEVYAQNLIESQLQNQHQVFVISDNVHVPLSTTWTRLTLSTASFTTRMNNIWQLREFIMQNKIDVIHCHSRGAVRHAYWARMGLKIAMVTSLHGRQHVSMSKKLMNIYGEQCIAICENVKKQMVEQFSMNSNSIQVLRNPCQINKSSQLAKTNFKSIALLGRSSGPKGERIEKIAQHCFHQWLSQFPDLHIDIVAPKPERFSQTFYKLLNELNQKYPQQIKVLGQIQNLTDSLSQYDLNICSGRIAIESLLSKTPVLAVGEDQTVGLVSEQTWSQALASNFGDIDQSSSLNNLNLEKINTETLEFLKQDLKLDKLGMIDRQVINQQQDQQILDQKIDQQLIYQQVFNKAQEEFSPQLIQNKILEIYKAAIFKRHHSKWIPILMYHKIPQEEIQTKHRIFVTVESFKKHLDFFNRQKFTTIGFADLKQFWDMQRPYSEFPNKPLILTFDDGYVDNLIQAQPLLLERKMKACIFLLANHNITENSWDLADPLETKSPLMNLQQKQNLNPACFEIGSHGFNHPHLTSLSETEVLAEMKDSRLKLSQDLSQDIIAFAYPFGSTSEKISKLCEKAGYRFAVNTDRGGLHIADDSFSIFRVNIFPEENSLSLWKKTSSFYRRRFFKKHGQ